MCTQSGGRVGGKHCKESKDFQKFQSRFKDFRGPFYDFQGPQANLTIFKAIPGLEFIFQNSRILKAFKAPRKPWFFILNDLILLGLTYKRNVHKTQDCKDPEQADHC